MEKGLGGSRQTNHSIRNPALPTAIRGIRPRVRMIIGSLSAVLDSAIVKAAGVWSPICFAALRLQQIALQRK